MKRFTLMIGFVFISGALTPFVSGAQERVAPFDRLISPRIVLTDGHQGAVSHRQMCPESNDTCRTYLAYTGYFVRNATILPRERELLILRTAWLSRGDYIWGRHNVMGQDAGLSKEEVSRVTSGPDAAGWGEFDTALLRAADDLHTSRFVSDETWNTLAQRYSESQLREVVLIVGNYTQLSMFHNTLGAQLEPDVAGLPDEAR
ncbi:MAG: carboxymuconolactone decarboxylase family protein [Acidobacteriota bacterium]|nr:carboxymuconolactone decarboxylase family protein [Acidobacteriota bacterium]